MKLQIKSFRVPELFIEIPETATVASLKVLPLNSYFFFARKIYVIMNAYNDFIFIQIVTIFLHFQ